MVGRDKKHKKSVGMGASEFAFIDDEIATVAMAYGLDMDEDVAKSIAKRTPSSKRKKALAAVVAPPKMDAPGLLSFLSKQCAVGSCKSPSCNCHGYSPDKRPRRLTRVYYRRTMASAGSSCSTRAQTRACAHACGARGICQH